MGHRVVVGLKWARPCGRPGCIPRSRPRGAKAQGVRYERALAKALPAARHGQWWEFEDRNGLGFCQTDLIWEADGRMVVLEVKYTWVWSGHTQLEQLYRPVVEAATGMGVSGIVVCKNLIPEIPRTVHVTGELGAALGLAKAGALCALHWLGLGPPMGVAFRAPAVSLPADALGL